MLEKALGSIYKSTLLPTYVVLIADGPLDESLQLIVDRFIQEKGLLFYQIPNNAGLAYALNFGLSKIKTELVIRADADDFNYTDRFEKLIAKLNDGFDLVGSAIREIDKSGGFVAIRRPPLDANEINKFIRKRNPFNHMSVGFRKDFILKCGGYPSIHLKEDYALWADVISSGGRVCNINDVLVDATAGLEMYQRRSGLRYALAEIDLQRHLVRTGLKSIPSAIFDGILRSAVFLAPNSVREFVYLRFLRVKKA